MRHVRLLALLLALAAPALAQIEGQPIVEVLIEGDVGVSHDLIRANLRTRPGLPFSSALIDQDTRWLANAHGVLADVAVEAGPLVRFRLLRVRRFERLTLEGNEEYPEGELRSLGQLPSDGAVAPDDVIRARDLLADHYLQHGFAFVQVDLETHSLGGEGSSQEAVLRVWEGPRVETTDVRIEGLTALDLSSAKSVMQAVPGLWDWFLGKDFVRSEVDRDVVLLEGFVRGEGYLDARVAISGLQFSPDRSEVVIILYVDEGQRYAVRSMRMEGVTAVDADALLADAALKVGGWYRRPDLVRTLRSLREAYGRIGHIDMSAAPEESFDEHEPLVDLVWRIEEGVPKHVRDVLVRGNTGTREGVVRRYLTVYPGDLVDRRELDYSEDALASLDAFTDLAGTPQVRVDTAPTPDPGLVDVTVDVGDNQSGLFSFLLGAGSDSGLFGGVSIDKRNFDISRSASSFGSFVREFFQTGEAFHGGGQRLFIEVVPGTETTNVDIQFSDPWLQEGREDPWGMTASLFGRERIFDDYDRNSRGASLLFDHRLSRESTISLGGGFDTTTISNADPAEVPTIAFFEDTYTNIGPEARWRYRSVDSLLEPSEGVDVGIRLENMGLLGGDVDANRLVVTSEWYTPIGESDDGKQKVLHPRVALGVVDPTGKDEDFPFYENFFVGGITGPFAVRGFDFQGVGPHESDTAIGGRLALAGSLEATLPIVTEYNPYRDKEDTLLKGVLFLDAGNLVPEVRFGDLLSDLRIAAGAGIRLRLPALGGVTLSLDWAQAISEQDGDVTRALSFQLSRRF